jgi:hypothetical protein
MYEILKDFAGPVATVIVAAFVGWITWSHNTTQTALARYNLRINLFERKYALYVAAREALAYLCSTRPDDIDWNRVTAWSFKIREAPFFFGKEVLEFLDHVEAMSENLSGKIEWRKEHPEEAGGMADKIRELQNLMSTELLRLPGIFERELQLKD